MTKLSRLRGSEGYAVRANSQAFSLRGGATERAQFSPKGAAWRRKRRRAQFAPTTRGRTGFDGDAEIGIAGGCACHPKNGQL